MILLSYGGKQWKRKLKSIAITPETTFCLRETQLSGTGLAHELIITLLPAVEEDYSIAWAPSTCSLSPVERVVLKEKKGGDKTLKHQFTELSSKVCSISHSFPNIILAEIFCSWLSLKDGMFQFCWMLVLLEKSAIFLREHLTLLNTFSEVAWYKIQ